MSFTLLEKKLGPLPDMDVATDLVQALDLVPLAISQAAAYIQARAPWSSPEKYLSEFRKSERRRSKLLQYDAGDLRRDGGASNAILTTWQISFEHIRTKGPSAADLLSLMSFFDRQGIPECVLEPSKTTNMARDRGLNKAVDEESNDGDTTADREDDSTGSDDNLDDNLDGDIDGRFEDDMAMLRDYCLIAVAETGDEFEIHGLVQLSTRKWLEVFERQEIFQDQFIERIAASFPIGEKAREKELGREDMATLETISLFALVQKDQGRWKEAESLFVQVVETSSRVLGEEHPSTLTSMGNLASTFGNQGRWKEAESLEVQVMETRKRVLGEEHPSTLTSMANLASTFGNQGRWKEAESLYSSLLSSDDEAQ
ncbi:hypothetical protein QBC37DRAFT_392927 [Rhypophila decipiens]|uniref:Kinesin light chain n=1 Tax=Rhypophila decipiens TaxID=261697 RepID=A0AAN7AZJ3_9PEZI|nr:hypothetical protein QBC37DRAFT_392927 [Rhypophila decipiens]